MRISVIGLGKLGKPIFNVFKENGYKVTGIDLYDPYKDLGEISFVVVPTPSKKDNKFISEYVENVLDKIKEKHIVAIVSTLMPGETDRLQKKYPHLTLVYNPTFVALGSVKHDFTHPDFILIGGNDKEAVKLVEKILLSVCFIKNGFAIMTPLEAEIAKLTLNCYITTKITFANQIGNLCYRLGIKPDNILEAVGRDRRVGSEYFKAGLGYGGPCFPRDNLALSAYMKDNGMIPELAKTVNSLNNLQIYEMVGRVIKLKPKIVGFESLSYKEGTDCEEYSHLKAIYTQLKERGYKVRIGKGDVTLDWRGL